MKVQQARIRNLNPIFVLVGIQCLLSLIVEGKFIKDDGYGKGNHNESTIRQTLNKHGVHGRIARRKPLLSKKNIAARLKFAKDHVDEPEGYWKNILWMDESKTFWFK